MLEKDTKRLKAIGRLTPGGWFRSRFVPFRSDATRLFLNKWMREKAQVGVGDRTRVTLKPDRGSRELPIPVTLGVAMSSNVKVKETWEALTSSRQREILTYLNFLKTSEALDRNVQKVIAELLTQQNSDS